MRALLFLWQFTQLLHDVQPDITAACNRAHVGAVLHPGAAVYTLVINVAHDTTFPLTRCTPVAGR